MKGKEEVGLSVNYPEKPVYPEFLANIIMSTECEYRINELKREAPRRKRTRVRVVCHTAMGGRTL